MELFKCLYRSGSRIPREAVTFEICNGHVWEFYILTTDIKKKTSVAILLFISKLRK